MYDWAKLSIGVLGAGIENIALTRFLLKNGAKVVLYDQNEPGVISEKIQDLDDDNLIIVSGKDYLEKVSQHDMFFRSPGMPLDYAEKITQNNGRLSSAMQLFFELCPAKIIGVTGTKGKGTTSSLIYEILKKFYDKKSQVFLVGNIGKAPFDIFEKLTKDDSVVIELSSFQLEDMGISPHIAVVLGITPDHLVPATANNPNYHKSLADYIHAKRKIVENLKERDFAVLVKSDEDIVEDFARHTKAHVDYCYLSGKGEGCRVESGWIVVDHKGKEEKILNLENIKLIGTHNIINIQAAVMAAYLAGANKNSIAAAVESFKGLPHRLEYVTAVEGISYYDDSYGTEPSATIAAIRAFSQPVILIIGGVSKGADFSELVQAIARSSVKGLIVVGEETENIIKMLKKERIDKPVVSGLTAMKDMVEHARKMAQEKDVVLLSPACASFDLFKNATDRGDQFQKYVRVLE